MYIFFFLLPDDGNDDDDDVARDCCSHYLPSGENDNLILQETFITCFNIIYIFLSQYIYTKGTSV